MAALGGAKANEIITGQHPDTRHEVYGLPATTFTYAGSINGQGTWDTQGPGVVFTGTSAAGVAIVVSGGELEDDGVINGPVTVQRLLILGGSGTINGPVAVNAGGEVDPGRSRAATSAP